MARLYASHCYFVRITINAPYRRKHSTHKHLTQDSYTNLVILRWFHLCCFAVFSLCFTLYGVQCILFTYSGVGGWLHFLRFVLSLVLFFLLSFVSRRLTFLLVFYFYFDVVFLFRFHSFPFFSFSFTLFHFSLSFRLLFSFSLPSSTVLFLSAFVY